MNVFSDECRKQSKTIRWMWSNGHNLGVPVSGPTDLIIRQIKETVDIVSLIGQYLQIHRVGSRFKALCPFHDDKNPSMEINPERQSYKCWACGAGGDCIEFVKQYERVEFPEAVRILADRVGINLDSQKTDKAVKGPAKPDIYRVLKWAEGFYSDQLHHDSEAVNYISGRGLSPESVSQFGLGYAPADSLLIKHQAKVAGFSEELLEACGILARSEEKTRTYDRFHERLMFPIRDMSSRTVGFGGRILPAREKLLAEQGKRAGKYVNSPETSVFQKRKLVYASDLARDAARQAKQVVVMEGYTDVMAAHQAGIRNVVGTLGTALGADHIPVLRQMADRIILVFDGDEAGLKAAERGLEIFLGQPVELALVALPDKLDPCDFLMTQGAAAFEELINNASDPLQFAIDRAESRFDLQNPEQARQAAEWVLSIFNRIPQKNNRGMDLKIGMALDRLAFRLRIPTLQIQQEWNRHRKEATKRNPLARPAVSDPGDVKIIAKPDPLEREFVELLLNFPELVGQVMPRVLASELKHESLRMITQSIYDTYRTGKRPEFTQVAELLDPVTRAFAAGLLASIEQGPLPANALPAEGNIRLAGVLHKFARRALQEHIQELKRALAQTSAEDDPETHQALQLELRRLLSKGLPPTGPLVGQQL